jgi:hypothetical protein
MGKQQVKEINVPAKPSAGTTRVKEENYRDTTRESVGKPRGKKQPEVDQEVQDRPGAARDAAMKQARDTNRKFFKPVE